MNFLEKDLEDIVFETPNELLRDRGLPIRGRKYRQLRLGNYGIADIVTLQRIPNKEYENGYIIITVYEFKKDSVGTSTLLQGFRYLKGISSYFEKRGIFLGTRIEYELILCGNSIEKNSDFVYIEQFIDFLDMYVYEYDFDGLSFKCMRNYSLIDEGF